jgi:hypothetical protein
VRSASYERKTGDQVFPGLLALIQGNKTLLVLKLLATRHCSFPHNFILCVSWVKLTAETSKLVSV